MRPFPPWPKTLPFLPLPRESPWWKVADLLAAWVGVSPMRVALIAFAFVPSSWETSTTKSAARKRRGREENLVQLCMIVSTLFLDVFLPSFLPGAGLGGAVAAKQQQQQQPPASASPPAVGAARAKGRAPNQGLRGGMVGCPPPRLLLSRRASRGGREGDGDLVPGGRRWLNPRKEPPTRQARLGRLG